MIRRCIAKTCAISVLQAAKAAKAAKAVNLDCHSLTGFIKDLLRGRFRLHNSISTYTLSRGEPGHLTRQVCSCGKFLYPKQPTTTERILETIITNLTENNSQLYLHVIGAVSTGSRSYRAILRYRKTSIHIIW